MAETAQADLFRIEAHMKLAGNVPWFTAGDLDPLVVELREAREILKAVTAVIAEIDPETDPVRWRQLDRALHHKRWL